MRSEKVAIKDIKLRTFIAQGRHVMIWLRTSRRYLRITTSWQGQFGNHRRQYCAGHHFEAEHHQILDRLDPKKIIIVSSSPQIRYPDCYGIDMSRMSEFIAFKAVIELLKERGMQHLIDEVYRKSVAQKYKPKEAIVNYVKEIYAPLPMKKSRPKSRRCSLHPTSKLRYRSFSRALRISTGLSRNNGDWYFSGNYPTPGGNRLVNNAFINYIEGDEHGHQQLTIDFKSERHD